VTTSPVADILLVDGSVNRRDYVQQSPSNKNRVSTWTVKVFVKKLKNTPRKVHVLSGDSALGFELVSRHSCRLTTDNLTSPCHTTTLPKHRNSELATDIPNTHPNQCFVLSADARLKLPQRKAQGPHQHPSPSTYPQNKHHNVRIPSTQRAQTQQQRQAGPTR
jgi:hypothetical protein